MVQQLSLQAVYSASYELQNQKMYLWTCAPSWESDQSAHSGSQIRIFFGTFWIVKDAKLFHVDNENSGQTAVQADLSTGNSRYLEVQGPPEIL